MKYYKNFALNIAPEPFYPRKYAISHFDDSSAIQRSKCLQQPLPSDVTFKQPKRCVHGFTYKTKTHYCSNSIHNTSVTNIHTHARRETVLPRKTRESAVSANGQKQNIIILNEPVLLYFALSHRNQLVLLILPP